GRRLRARSWFPWSVAAADRSCLAMRPGVAGRSAFRRDDRLPPAGLYSRFTSGAGAHPCLVGGPPARSAVAVVTRDSAPGGEHSVVASLIQRVYRRASC